MSKVQQNHRFMPDASVSGTPCLSDAFHLCGQVEGVDRSFYLARGRHRVGSLPDCDVVLPVPGVSRRHAILTVVDGALEIEDLDTKNGTGINGAEIRKSAARVGDVLAFGPVDLRVATADLGEAELAVRFATPTPPIPSHAGAETDFVSDGVAAAVLLEGLERFVVALADCDSSGLGCALGVLGQNLEAQGLAVVLWPRGASARILGAVGAVEELSLAVEREERERRAWVDQALRTGEWRWHCEVDEEAPVTQGVLPISPSQALGLCLVGDFHGRQRSEALMRLLLRLLAKSGLLETDLEVEVGEVQPRKALTFPSGSVVGTSVVMTRLVRDLETFCDSDLSLLLLGETGVGKEVVARAVHLSSVRREQPFVAVNCAAIPADLLESEMFGIKRGVATGVEARQGSFQKAHGGTLFLDEIGEMPAALQAKLLRALQEKEVQPLGGSPVAVDVRLVAATNIELERLLGAGTFRSDLYFRLAGAVVNIPPLRDRREDIPTLAAHFGEKFCRASGRSTRGITARAMHYLVRYSWPGNVRELEHEIRRAVYRCPPGDAIDSTMLSENLRLAAAAAGPPRGGPFDLKERLGNLERRLITLALEEARGNRTQAARLLGISRNTLASKIAFHEIPACSSEGLLGC